MSNGIAWITCERCNKMYRVKGDRDYLKSACKSRICPKCQINERMIENG